MKTLTAALLVVVLTATCRADDKAEWKEFACEDGQFKVLMPGAPKQGKVEIEGDYGPSVLHMNTVEIGDSFYGAHYCDYPEGVKKVPLKQVYDTSRDIAAENMGGEVISEKDIKLQEHPGREIRIGVNGGKLLFRARVFLVGTRLHQVVAFGPKEAATSKDADRFLDSFRLTD